MEVIAEILQCAELMPPAQLHATHGGLIKLKISLPTALQLNHAGAPFITSISRIQSKN